MIRRLLAPMLALAVLAAGCSIRTIDRPADGVEVQARFATVNNLVVGHTVQLADVTVGTVIAIELDGHEAVVTMAIEDRGLPEGTRAAIGRTSLLGEDVVQLEPPAVAGGRPLQDGDVLPAGQSAIGVEELTQRSIELLAALSGDDLPRLMDAATDITVGREDEITELVGELAEVTSHYAGQRDRIAEAIDVAGDLGAQLAQRRERLGAMVEDVADATGVLAATREDAVAVLVATSRLAAAAQGSILDGTREELEEVLDELGPVLRAFADDERLLTDMLASLQVFVERIPEAVRDDELELYGYFTFGAPRRSPLDTVTGILESPFETLADLLDTPLHLLGQLLGGGS